jgi:hypothetical protein
MKTTYVTIPVFEPDLEAEPDYSRQFMITLEVASGFRAIMGAPSAAETPDVLIERGESMWRVFVHPDAGDPVVIVEIGNDNVKVSDDFGNVMLERPLR